MPTYAPLKLLSEMEAPGREAEIRIEALSQAVPAMKDYNEKQYVDLLLRLRFSGIPEDDRVMQDLAKLLMNNTHVLMQATGINMQDIRSGKIDFVTEWQDIYLMPVHLDIWSRNKQIFKPDSDFAKALLGTDELYYTRETFRHLPCKNFYIDLEDCDVFSPACGVFVNIDDNTEPDRVFVSMYMLMPNPAKTGDYLTFSFYTKGKYDQDGRIDFDVKEFKSLDYQLWSPINGVREILQASNATENKTLIYLLAFQMICYLSIEKPEIEESETTKRTYKPRKPGQPVKNKFSEIQTHDVGVRYGKEFRRKILALKDSSYDVNEKGGNAETDPNRPKRSVRPHYRCAHWHRYRYGKGRTEIKTVWQEPIFVVGTNVDQTNASTDAVIHRVRKEKS